MKIGDEVLIKGRIVDMDCNPQGSAIKVVVIGSKAENKDLGWQGSEHKTSVTFWIHRLDQPKALVIQETPKKETTG